MVSSELVLLSRNHAYFFLGGTLADAFELRPNELLQVETFRWCRSAGKTALVLGGGYRGSEGLLKYKRGFAPGRFAEHRTTLRDDRKCGGEDEQGDAKRPRCDQADKPGGRLRFHRGGSAEFRCRQRLS